jgi:hypothetical protein
MSREKKQRNGLFNV